MIIVRSFDFFGISVIRFLAFYIAKYEKTVLLMYPMYVYKYYNMLAREFDSDNKNNNRVWIWANLVFSDKWVEGMSQKGELSQMDSITI